jgi:hypothetical protein
MKKTEQKKLKLNLETLRNLKQEELGKVVGAASFWTATERAGGCTVTADGIDCGGNYTASPCTG